MKTILILLSTNLLAFCLKETDFDPISTLRRFCGFSPFNNIPTIPENETHVNFNLTLTLDRLVAISDVEESFTIRTIIAIYFNIPCLIDLYQSDHWPKELQLFNGGSTELLWGPSLVLRNSIDVMDLEKIGGFKERMKFFMLEGRVQLLRYIPKLTASCDMNYYQFPFDVQICYVEFTTLDSATFAERAVINTKGKYLIDSAIPPNFDWLVLNQSDEQVGEIINFEKYQTIRLSLSFQRKPEYFTLNIFAPGLILQILELSSFFLPPDTPDRATYSITIMLSLYVLRTEVLSHLPSTPKPVVIAYYTFGATVFTMFCAIYGACICWLVGINFKNIKKPKQIAKRYSVVEVIDFFSFTLALLAVVFLNMVTGMIIIQ